MASQHPQPITLRNTIIIRVFALIFVLMLVVGLSYTLLGLQPTAKKVAAAQFELAATQVEAELNAIFLPAERLLSISKEWMKDKPPALQPVDEFNRIYQPIIEKVPQFTSVVAGTSTGQAWLLLKHPDGGWHNRITDLPRWGKNHLIVKRQPDGQIIRTREFLDYDARQRPWYQAAVDGDIEGKVYWTQPYIFYTTRDPGITASIFWKLPDGEKMALGVDLLLQDLSQVTMQATVGNHGMALVVSDDWRIIGLPKKPAITDATLWRMYILEHATQLPLAPLNQAISVLQQHPDQQTAIQAFQNDDQRWLVTARPYPLGNQNLYVVTLAPEAEFMPNWSPILITLLISLIILLILAFIVTHRQVRHITQPLEALVEASERIGKLDFAQTTSINSRILEIQRLSQSQDTMRELLKQNQHTLATQAKSLREQLAAQYEAEQKLRLDAVVFEQGAEAVTITDAQTRILSVNRAFTQMTGYLPDEVIGKTPRLLQSGRHDDNFYRNMWTSLNTKGKWQGEIWNRRKSGEIYPEWLSISTVVDSTGTVTHYVATSSDISDTKAQAARIEQLAYFDLLTGLHNRALFLDRLHQALQNAKRHKLSMSLLFFDLNRFKEINDTQGHSVGDAVLAAVARRFQDVVTRNESLARIGGDEFVVLAPDTDRNNAGHIAKRILASLLEPVEIDNQRFTLSASIGIALYPDDGETPDELLKQADIAMYHAKTLSTGYQFYTQEMSTGLAEQITLALDLQRTLQNDHDELILFYQPQFNLKTNQLLGAEVLLRWQHPTRGLLSPGTFIPVAEQRGMMLELGDWVIKAACQQLATWQQQGLVLPGRLAVNIAAQQFDDPDFVRRILTIIQSYNLTASEFELELTESGLMRNIDQVLNIIKQLKKHGFALAIDDFGTGYSSLSYLRRFPVDRVKIDMSFIHDMNVDRSAHAIVATIIGMGRTLNLTTVAEGVESIEQAQGLQELGCDAAQGFYYGRPVPAEDFAGTWMKARDLTSFGKG